MVNKIVYLCPSDTEVFDKQRFIASLEKYGAINMEVLNAELAQYNNPVLHVSCLVEIGAKAIIDEEKAKQYYDEHDDYRGLKFERLRRITGYLVGSLERWNDGKQAEERDRVKHGLPGQYTLAEKDAIEAAKLENTLSTQI